MNPTFVTVSVRYLTKPGADLRVMIGARIYPDPAGYDFSVLGHRVYPFHDIGPSDALPVSKIFNRAAVMICQGLTALSALTTSKVLHSGLHPDARMLSAFVMSRTDPRSENPLTDSGQQFH